MAERREHQLRRTAGRRMAVPVIIAAIIVVLGLIFILRTQPAPSPEGGRQPLSGNAPGTTKQP